jgi:predicted dehydrogenase
VATDELEEGMPIRVGVIGSSFGGTTIVPGFRRLEDVEIVALVSGRMERAQSVAQQLGIPHAFEDYRAMLDGVEVDLVSVAAPPHLHYEMVMECVRRGKHVICEKPFAIHLGQAREMLQAAERAGVVHALNHEFRYFRGRTGFKQRVDEGFLGEARLIRIVWRSDSRANPEQVPLDWWFQRERGGGILGAIGSHYIDSLRWWFGEITGVAAQLDAFVKQRRLPDGSGWGEVTADDTSTLLFQVGRHAAQATLSLTAVAGVRGSRVEAYGSAGSLVIEDDDQLLGAAASGALEPLPTPDEPFPPVKGEPRTVGPCADLAARVIARIRGERGPDFPTFREGAAVQAVMDAAHRSSDERRWATPEAV